MIDAVQVYERWELQKWMWTNLPLDTRDKFVGRPLMQHQLQGHNWDPMAIGILHEASEAKLVGRCIALLTNSDFSEIQTFLVHENARIIEKSDQISLSKNFD